MFSGASSLERLDLSGWNTSKEDLFMTEMFSGASSLKRLDISNWDTSKVFDMTDIFTGTTLLSSLTLGENFQFMDSDGNGDKYDSDLPDIAGPLETYSGKWINVGDGTIDDPNGTYILTSSELMNTYDGATMADTYIWQKWEHMEKVKNPTSQLPSGAYDAGIKILLDSATPNAKIYYSLDGSEPTINSTLYTSPITLEEDMTLKIIAVKDGMRDSDIVTYQYTVTQQDISRLVIDSYVGAVNQEDSTITFEIPENELVTGTYTGTITELVASESEVIFLINGNEHIHQQGDLVSIRTGDKVYVVGGKKYQFIIKSLS
jgi:surface protein